MLWFIVESNESALEDEEPYLRDQNQKQKATILHGRQAEKVQKALQKAAEARERREKREQEVRYVVSSSNLIFVVVAVLRRSV